MNAPKPDIPFLLIIGLFLFKIADYFWGIIDKAIIWMFSDWLLLLGGVIYLIVKFRRAKWWKTVTVLLICIAIGYAEYELFRFFDNLLI